MEGKRIYKSKMDRKIFGVCGGIGTYFNVDSTVVRLAMALLGLCGAGILFYIVAAVIIPEEP